MANPTIYGKVDCYTESLTGVQTVDMIRTSQEVYVGLYKFLEYLQTQGLTTLVTYYAGSGSSGTGKDYWDTVNAAGTNSFSVWKISSNADRNWDWYLYIHGMNGGGNLQVTANSTPSRVTSGTTFTDETVMIAMQAAFSISGSSSINPWNGTIDLTGGATKGSQVWNTGSAGYTVHVFPRANNPSGSYNAAKEYLATVLHTRFYQSGGGIKANGRARYHYFFDGHGFLFAIDHTVNNVALPKNYYVSYVGPYSLLESITLTNSGSANVLGGSGSFGFTMLSMFDGQANNLWNAPPTHVMQEYTTYGPVSPSTVTVPEGGVFATNTIGVRSVILANDNTFHTTVYSPNPFAGNTYDERIYSVLSNEPGFGGFAGLLTTPLVRCIVGTPASHDMATDGSRAVLAANATSTNRKITVPWTGSISAPGTNLTRNGIIMNIPNYTL